MQKTNALEIITDARVWDAYLAAHDAHLLQTYAWGELKSQFGWRVERVAWRDGETIRAAAQILYRPLAPLLTLAYIPRGPVATDTESLVLFLKLQKLHVRARNTFFLKLEPDWARGDARAALLRRTGATPSRETIQPPTTIQIDLTADLETILARMKSKWRYNIRLSEKKNIVVRAGAIADFDAFYPLMQLTSERDHFVIHHANYYRTAFELWHARDNVQLFIAEFEHKPLAMIFVTAFAQEAIYLYGASSNEERNRMPNHALHWAAMQWAKARGCTRYDLWGIPDDERRGGVIPPDSARVPQQGGMTPPLPDSLYQFKQGFGGEIVRYTGAWDFVFNKPKYRLYQLARKFRKNGLG